MMPDVDCGLCHASAIHISFAVSLFVSRQSWNPTSTKSIGITKSASTFVLFRKCLFTILHVNDRFSSFPVTLCTHRRLFRCAASFIVQRFCSSSVTSRSNVLRSERIEIHAQPKAVTRIRFAFGVWRRI